tara:strand:- start:248 stop:610 length:363 start_codon:yes stop_codon:yes gene_type:complete
MPKKQGARVYRTKNNPQRRQIVSHAIQAIRQGVDTETICKQHGVKAATLNYWLRHNIDAYHARLYSITNFTKARDPKNDAFWRRVFTQRLVTYRKLNGLPPNPSPRRKSKPPNSGPDDRV